MELLYKKSEAGDTQLTFSNIRWLSANEYPVFCRHLEICGQKLLPKSGWDETYNAGTIYCGLFIPANNEEIQYPAGINACNGYLTETAQHNDTKLCMAGRACVEKYSQSAWEIADVRVARPYRNRGYAYMLCCFVFSYILSEGKIATIRTEEDNFAMQRVIEKLGFARSFF